MPRLFVALDLPGVLAAELVRLGRAVPGARPLPAGRLHLTLRFLGEVEDPVAAAVEHELAGIRAAAFELTPEGLGCFPKPKRATVAWAGLAPSEELAALQSAVEKAVQAAGLPAEARRFRPHLTLARWRRPEPRSATAWLDENAGFRAAPFAVEAFHLYSSVLRPAGAVHERLVSFPLASES